MEERAGRVRAGESVNVPERASEGEPGPLPDGTAGAIAPLPATAALEAIIAQLLEPVLRHWLEVNLPGLVERAIREEVARQLRKPAAGAS